MGFRSFGTGSVLRDSQVAPANSSTTGMTQTGVVRDARPVPAAYNLDADAPSFVDAAASQYRASVVEAPGTTTTEYLVWAANTADLAGPTNPDPSWWTETGYGKIPVGTTTVGAFTDGSILALVTDNGNKDIGRIYSIVVARGDVSDYDDEGWKDPDDTDPASFGGQPRKGDNPYLTLYFDVGDQDPRLGLVYLTDAHIASLGGGLSLDRGDQIMVVHYTVSSARFWWSKNDRYESRFGWAAQSRRWEPFKGTIPQNMGVLKSDVSSYNMIPAIKNLPAGSSLPAGAADAYGMIRVGTSPSSAQSVPVAGIVVRPDAEYGTAFPANYNGRMGQSNGKLEFNPTFVAANLGKTVWYVPNTFTASNDGIVGHMTDQELFIAPVPSMTEMPLIRFGSRKYLTAAMVATDAALLASAHPQPGNVMVSASTGKMRFNALDLAKADPSSSTFNKHFLGEFVVYDGVSLSGMDQPTRAPVQLLDAAGAPATASSLELYIPAYVYLPTEFASANTRRGLGTSGILDAPDGTGAIPDQAGVDASLRPGGDNTADVTTGRIRQVHDGVSDTILFTQLGSVETIVVVDTDSEVPTKIPGGTAYVVRQMGAHGSRVYLSSIDKTRFGVKPIFFLQAAFNPASYTAKARLVSRNRNIFRFDGTEILRFAIDGAPHTWASATLVSSNPSKTYFTTAEVVADIGLPTVYASAERIVIEAADPDTGSVEIGFGVVGVLDLSGCKALGFVPGWRAVGGIDNWLPDSGVSLGMYRTPMDPTGINGTSDFRAVDRVENQVLIDGIQAMPFYFLNTVPLQDIAGIEEGIFFNLSTTVTDGDTTTVINKNLEHYRDIIHRFTAKKFDWMQEVTVDGQVYTPTTTLNFNHVGIAPESFESAVGGGLYVSKDGRATKLLTRDTDYIIPQNGVTGNALLIERFLGTVTFGSNGQTVSGANVFSDPNVDFSTTSAKVGDILDIQSGDAQGIYTVTNVTSALELHPAPTATATGTWELASGVPSSDFDPALVADIAYVDFDHLPQETMIIRILTPLVIPTAGLPKALMSKALANGRVMSLRIGSTPPSSITTLIPLRKIDMGVPYNGLVIPDTTGPRFSSQRFALQAGPVDTFNPLGVSSFSSDPTGIEYLTQDTIDGVKGTLKFGSAFMSAWSRVHVYFVDLFMNDTDLPQGTAEYDPNTGEVNMSSVDVAASATARALGNDTYFVEELITKARKDVAINPILGAFSTNDPLTRGTLVEASYWQADLEGRKVGNQINEFLPVFVRNEVATQVKTNVYTFNTALTHRVDQAIEPTVYIGPIRQNYGQLDYILDYPASLNGAGQITFVSHTVDPNVSVKVSYAVFDMSGGERSFEVSSKPVYRPPFYIGANQDRFGLKGDRTTEFLPGQMLRIGEECFYVKSLKYYPQNANNTGDVTAVYIFPPTINEVGSRAPGNDVLTVITNDPITTVVDPDGTTPVVTLAPTGLQWDATLQNYPTFDPIVRGQKTWVVYGTEMPWPVGSILEIGGVPYTIAKIQLSDDGSRTQVTVTSAFRSNLTVSDHPTIKITYRPVYPPGAEEFLGVGAILTTEAYSVCILDSTAPGRSLAMDVECTIDSLTGNIRIPGGISSTQKIMVRFTRWDALTPTMVSGVPVIPWYTALFMSQQFPDESNGILNGKLAGTYSFASPDAFYFRAVPLRTFVGEVVEEISAEIDGKQPASGALNYTTGGTKNWQNGTWDLLGERRALMDKDRVARTFLEYYNNVILAFEQVGETISGGFVGDKDGKFHFWVGHDNDWPKPGYEDPITGYLTTHHVWTDIVNQENPTAQYFGTSIDPVVDPSTINVVSGKVVGSIVSSNTLTDLIRKQRGLVFNDVDDVVLVSLRKMATSYDFALSTFVMTSQGMHKSMGDEHQLSRLFPTNTKAMIRTLPGIGASPGVYSAGILVNGELQKTAGGVIAQLRNPVVGDITNVSSANLHKRRARARVWGWFPDGLPASAFGGAITVPCIIAVPDLLRNIAIVPETGYPDPTKFISQSVTGTQPDAEAGDPELAIPGFVAGDQISWGQPDGTVYPAYNHLDPILIGTTSTYTGVFVDAVQFGCVITFMDAYGVTITDPNAIFAGATSITNLPIEQGSTILVGSPTASFTDAPPDPAEFSTLQTMNAGTDTYRDGFDVKVSSDGTLIDLSLPSKADGTYLYLKELFGQNAPQPLDALEGPVSFALGNQNPLLVPALAGNVQDDSGDYQIPYLLSSNTEMDRFAEASVGLSNIYAADDLGHSIYPDEIVGKDGSIVSTVGANPATMTTAQFTQPAYAAGVAPAKPFDLVLTQISGANPFTTDGALGITTMGALDDQHWIEPPRFNTPTQAPTPGLAVADPMTYIVENAMVYVDGNYPVQPQVGPPPNGVYVIEDVPNGRTILDFGTTTIALNDGHTVAVGNLNYIHAKSGRITIRLIARQDADVVNGPAGVGVDPWVAPGGLVALTIEIDGLVITVTDYKGNTTGPIALGGVTFGDQVVPVLPIIDNRQIIINNIGIIPWGPGPGTPAQWFLPHTLAAGPVYTMLYGFEYSISIDALNPAAVAVDTAWISEDRLTFNEVYDLSFAKKRGFNHPQSAIDLETKLSVYQVTVGVTTVATTMSSINRWQNGWVGINPIPYTFVPRADATTVGYWASRVGATTERGHMKVMAYEGHNNTAVTTTSDVTFSVIPSDDRCALGPILNGWGKTASRYSFLADYNNQRFDNRITEITRVGGDEDRVEPGDIVAVTGSANASHRGSHQTGTYLVRHAVRADAAGDDYVTKAPVTYAGLESGWCPLHFPTVVSFDAGIQILVLSDDAPTPGGPAGSGFPVAAPGVTRIYIIRNINDLASHDAAVFKYAVISANYTARLGPAFVLTDYRDALNNVIAAATFEALLDKAYQVSGMTFWPVNVSGAQYGLPDNNCVGFDSPSQTLPVPVMPYANWAIYGFHLLSFVPQGALASATTQVWTADEDVVPAPYILKVAGTPKCVVPMEGTLATTYQFQADPLDAVYHWVVRTLNVSDVDATQWKPLNVPPGSAGVGGALVNCILPGTKLALASGANDGYYAQTGIFTEPTFPRSSLDMVAANARIVDATHSLPDPAFIADREREMGMRDAQSYSTVLVPDQVSFTVKRIRRFHEVLDAANQNMMPLRYAYEIRRGIITAYSTDNKQLGQVSALGFTWTDGNVYTGTQLGNFANSDVNVNAGDIFRVLDADGSVIEEVRIASVKSTGQLVLDAPGLQSPLVLGTTQFQIFLKKAPVPHEQSGEELLDVITDKRICNTVANWTTQKGGYVPDITGVTTYANAVNRLYDDLNAPNQGDFATLGVKKGDIIIIDPAGVIPQDGGLPSTQESGRRPLGDEGVPDRTDAGVYTAGTPSPLDDNRGFYRVKAVVDTANPPYLSVTPINTYAGDEANPVVFADDPYAYAVYPTVTDSDLKKAPYPVGNGKEAQMALRPTLKRDVVTKSFSDRTDGFIGHSIRPFSYHIIRPTKMMSDEAIDLVLMMRERMLSLIELLRAATLGLKYGSYFVFQRDEHIKEVGSPTDPDIGLGMPSNLFLEAVGGRMDVVPYANNSGCLSIMDRRAWVHDTRLDSLTSDGHGGMKTKGLGDVAYTAYTTTAGSKVLPVLPERIDEVLDTRDKLRLLRYVWLSYRTHKILGTLASIRRFDETFPQRLSDQKKSIQAVMAAEKAVAE